MNQNQYSDLNDLRRAFLRDELPLEEYRFCVLSIIHPSLARFCEPFAGLELIESYLQRIEQIDSARALYLAFPNSNTQRILVNSL